MNDSPLYSVDQITKTYERVSDHRLTKKIISNYSTNTSDVRELALSNLNLEHVREVLDLGCGYGLFEEKLKNKLPENAFITGVDLISSNEKAFLKTIEEAGYKGKFINSAAHIIKSFKSMTYDMVIASYSLYFFPELIEEIARVLRPSGVFITITHSKKSLKEVTGLLPKSMKIKGLKPPEELAINRLLSAFCVEDGHIKLKGHFNEVEVIHYSNSMLFKTEDISDCIEYLAKKRPLLFKEVLDASPVKAEEVESHFYSALQDMVQETGSLLITKDDAIFRAFRPINREKT
jgi:ubiquinone/menaquinone biosynthesis C-methylase UbiE